MMKLWYSLLLLIFPLSLWANTLWHGGAFVDSKLPKGLVAYSSILPEDSYIQIHSLDTGQTVVVKTINQATNLKGNLIAITSEVANRLGLSKNDSGLVILSDSSEKQYKISLQQARFDFNDNQSHPEEPGNKVHLIDQKASLPKIEPAKAATGLVHQGLSSPTGYNLMPFMNKSSQLEKRNVDQSKQSFFKQESKKSLSHSDDSDNPIDTDSQTQLVHPLPKSSQNSPSDLHNHFSDDQLNNFSNLLGLSDSVDPKESTPKANTAVSSLPQSLMQGSGSPFTEQASHFKNIDNTAVNKGNNSIGQKKNFVDNTQQLSIKNGHNLHVLPLSEEKNNIKDSDQINSFTQKKSKVDSQGKHCLNPSLWHAGQALYFKNIPVAYQLNHKQSYVQLSSSVDPSYAQWNYQKLTKLQSVFVYIHKVKGQIYYSLVVGPIIPDQLGFMLSYYQHSGYTNAYTISAQMS